MDQAPATIVTFRDALGLAMALSDEYAFANAAALIDAHGDVLDLAIVEGIGRTIEPVVEWATGDSHPWQPQEHRQHQDLPPITRRTRPLGHPLNHPPRHRPSDSPDHWADEGPEQPAGGLPGHWAHRRPGQRARGLLPAPIGPGGHVCNVLLVSVRPYEPDIVREQDLRLYRSAGWALSGSGARLLDWIETDGDLFRSYAYVTCPAMAWADDPPAERLRADGPP